MMKSRNKKGPDIRRRVPYNTQADQQLTGRSVWDAKADAKKKTLYDAAFESGYRTHAGHWKRSDEPDDAEQLRQSDRIQQILKARRQQASRERLKSKDAVPTKNGKKIFDEFMKEARQYQPTKKQSRISTKDLDDLRSLYNAASALEFEKWVLFANDLLNK